MVKRLAISKFPLAKLPLFILLFTLVVMNHRLLLGESFYWGLPSLQFHPWRMVAFDQLREGILPLWNSFNGAGAPLFANYQSALLYPLNWLGAVLPVPQTMSWINVLHLFLGGWGIARFLQFWGIQGLGQGIAALSFGLTAFLVGRLGTYPIINAVVWLPWILWACSRVMVAGDRRGMAWIGLFTALMLTAGHAQMSWYSLLMAGLFSLYLAVILRVPVRLFGTALGVIVGVGCASLQLFATAELLIHSQRETGVGYDFAMNFSYAPARILNLILPNLFGTPADGTYYTQGAYFEDAAYFGVIPLFFALSAALRWRHRLMRSETPALMLVPLFVGFFIIGLVLALGRYSPIFPFLYEHIPTFDLFQAPVRWHLWTVLAGAVLAGIGIQSWQTARRNRRWVSRILVVGIALVGVSLLIRILPSTTDILPVLGNALFIFGLNIVMLTILRLRQPVGGSASSKGWQALLFCVVAVDLAIASYGLNPTINSDFYQQQGETTSISLGDTRGYWPETVEQLVKYEQIFRFDDYRVAEAYQSFLRLQTLPNLNMLSGTALFNQFDPLIVANYADYLKLIETSTHPASLLQGAGIGFLYHEMGEPQPTDREASRAWLLQTICWHETETELMSALQNPEWNPHQVGHILGDGGCTMRESMPNLGNATIIVDQGTQVQISVSTNQPVWLVLADVNYPGWHAEIEGQDIPIFQINHAFRAVQVPTGENTVTFSYQPAWLIVGAWVSLISIIILLGLFRLETPIEDMT